MKKLGVIISSLRCIGYNLAAAFLEHDCAADYNRRFHAALDKALTSLRSKFAQELIFIIYPNHERDLFSRA